MSQWTSEHKSLRKHVLAFPVCVSGTNLVSQTATLCFTLQGDFFFHTKVSFSLLYILFMSGSHFSTPSWQLFFPVVSVTPYECGLSLLLIYFTLIYMWACMSVYEYMHMRVDACPGHKRVVVTVGDPPYESAGNWTWVLCRCRPCSRSLSYLSRLGISLLI